MAQAGVSAELVCLSLLGQNGETVAVGSQSPGCLPDQARESRELSSSASRPPPADQGVLLGGYDFISLTYCFSRQLSVEQALLGEEGTGNYVTHGDKLAVTLGGCM